MSIKINPITAFKMVEFVNKTDTTRAKAQLAKWNWFVDEEHEDLHLYYHDISPRHLLGVQRISPDTVEPSLVDFSINSLTYINRLLKRSYTTLRTLTEIFTDGNTSIMAGVRNSFRFPEMTPFKDTRLVRWLLSVCSDLNEIGIILFGLEWSSASLHVLQADYLDLTTNKRSLFSRMVNVVQHCLENAVALVEFFGEYGDYGRFWNLKSRLKLVLRLMRDEIGGVFDL